MVSTAWYVGVFSNSLRRATIRLSEQVPLVPEEMPVDHPIRRAPDELAGRTVVIPHALDSIHEHSRQMSFSTPLKLLVLSSRCVVLLDNVPVVVVRELIVLEARDTVSGTIPRVRRMHAIPARITQRGQVVARIAWSSGYSW